MCDCLVSFDVDSGLVRDYLMLGRKKVCPWTFSVFGGFKCLLEVEICGWRRGVCTWLEASNFWKLFYGSWCYQVLPNALWRGGVGSMLEADHYIASRLWSGHKLPQFAQTSTSYVELVFSVISLCWSNVTAQFMGYPWNRCNSERQVKSTDEQKHGNNLSHGIWRLAYSCRTASWRKWLMYSLLRGCLKAKGTF